MKKIVALLLPIGLFFGYHLLSFNLFNLCVAFILGIYVKLLHLLKVKERRIIAGVHVGLMIILMIYEMSLGVIPLEVASGLAHFKRAIDYYKVIPYLFMFFGLAISMTRHNRIQPLCPLPKTRMTILIFMPLLWLVLKYVDQLLALNYLGYLTTRLSYLLYGLLMGFYVWMIERLNDKNRRIVSFVHLGMVILLCGLIYFDVVMINRSLMIQWLIFSTFAFILRIFKVEFISRSQNTDIV